MAQAHADDAGPAPARPGGSIGIRLLEASSNRRDDPRARLYIVDHINPGTTISRRFEITNTSGAPQRVTLFPGAAEIRDNAFMPSADRDANELASWVSIDRPNVVVPPYGRIPLRATISVPPNASRGERYGGIWAEVASPRRLPDGRPGIQTINRVGIRIYLDVGPGGDPPSDFEIVSLTPGRTPSGLPQVRATVRNTGERALDLVGRMWLSDGPSGLSAGPIPAQVGTTLAPGGTAPVAVVLGETLPDGPWRVKLELSSGRVHRTVTGTLTFPPRPASWGRDALIDSALPWFIGVIAAAILAVTALMALLVRRRRTGGS
ncbi:MAG: hypothetical protein IRZ07_00845 [Microbispora sp.]|nr:hypothetical protein [Microbispora sp.]